MTLKTFFMKVLIRRVTAGLLALTLGLAPAFADEGKASEPRELAPVATVPVNPAPPPVVPRVDVPTLIPSISQPSPLSPPIMMESRIDSVINTSSTGNVSFQLHESLPITTPQPQEPWTNPSANTAATQNGSLPLHASESIPFPPIDRTTNINGIRTFYFQDGSRFVLETTEKTAVYVRDHTETRYGDVELIITGACSGSSETRTCYQITDEGLDLSLRGRVKIHSYSSGTAQFMLAGTEVESRMVSPEQAVAVEKVSKELLATINSRIKEKANQIKGLEADLAQAVKAAEPSKKDYLKSIEEVKSSLMKSLTESEALWAKLSSRDKQESLGKETRKFIDETRNKLTDLNKQVQSYLKTFDEKAALLRKQMEFEKENRKRLEEQRKKIEQAKNFQDLSRLQIPANPPWRLPPATAALRNPISAYRELVLRTQRLRLLLLIAAQRTRR